MLYSIRMLYLKYRPRTVGELDNSTAREALGKLLATKKLPHAFLFTGQKGTGKTSSARILAKAVNCLENSYSGKSDSYEPCNKCANCKSIDSGSSPDVFELDAASNRGIDEVRNLIKEAGFAPMAGNYRVFIIDEAHMITNDAFNALLKTLEEPPPSVIFILATTNEEKVPKTIVSRCYAIKFSSAVKLDIKSKLNKIIIQENMRLPDGVVDLISQHSEHSFRDAIRLLEELIVQNKLTEEEAAQYLGVRTTEGILELLDKDESKDALQWVEEHVKTGGSIKHLIADLIDATRDHLMKLKGVDVDSPTSLHLTVQESMVLIKSLQEAYASLRITPIESLPLEIALIEFYNYKNRNTK